MPGTVLDVGHRMATEADTILVMEPCWCRERQSLLSLHMHLLCFLSHVLRFTLGREHGLSKSISGESGEKGEEIRLSLRA